MAEADVRRRFGQGEAGPSKGKQKLSLSSVAREQYVSR